MTDTTLPTLTTDDYDNDDDRMAGAHLYQSSIRDMVDLVTADGSIAAAVQLDGLTNRWYVIDNTRPWDPAGVLAQSIVSHHASRDEAVAAMLIAYPQPAMSCSREDDQPIDQITIDGWTTLLYRQCPNCGCNQFPRIDDRCEGCTGEEAQPVNETGLTDTELDALMSEPLLPYDAGAVEAHFAAQDAAQGVTEKVEVYRTINPSGSREYHTHDGSLVGEVIWSNYRWDSITHRAYGRFTIAGLVSADAAENMTLHPWYVLVDEDDIVQHQEELQHAAQATPPLDIPNLRELVAWAETYICTTTGEPLGVPDSIRAMLAEETVQSQDEMQQESRTSTETRELEDVLEAIEAMGWDIDSLTTWKVGSYRQWRATASRVATPTTETRSRRVADGSSALASAIKLRDLLRSQQIQSQPEEQQLSRLTTDPSLPHTYGDPPTVDAGWLARCMEPTHADLERRWANEPFDDDATDEEDAEWIEAPVLTEATMPEHLMPLDADEDGYQTPCRDWYPGETDEPEDVTYRIDRELDKALMASLTGGR